MAQAESGTLSEDQAPVDLEEKIARDVMVIFQKQMDSEAAAEEASAYIWQNAGTQDNIYAFVDATELWLESHGAADKFAALSWNGLANRRDSNENYDTLLRMMIDSILDGSLKEEPKVIDDLFGFEILTKCPNVPDEILEPRKIWPDVNDYDKTAFKLAKMFNDNFKKFEKGTDSEILKAGPKIS